MSQFKEAGSSDCALQAEHVKETESSVDEDVLVGFIANLLRPGIQPQVVAALNITLAMLSGFVLLLYFSDTGNMHVFILSFLLVGLFASMRWSVTVYSLLL